MNFSRAAATEARVPFIVSAPLNPAYRARGEGPLDSWRIFEFALNGTR